MVALHIYLPFSHDTVNCYEEFKNGKRKGFYANLYKFLGHCRIWFEFEIACSKSTFREHGACTSLTGQVMSDFRILTPLLCRYLNLSTPLATVTLTSNNLSKVHYNFCHSRLVSNTTCNIYTPISWFFENEIRYSRNPGTLFIFRKRKYKDKNLQPANLR